MKRIQANKHKIGIYEIDKISLSCFDDKRYLLDGGVHTLAYFHKDSHKLKKRLRQLKKILSSIAIEAIETVFIFIFFMKDILSI